MRSLLTILFLLLAVPCARATPAVVAPVAAMPALSAADTSAAALDLTLGAGPVYLVPVHEMVDNMLARYVARAIDDAAADDAALVVFHVDTFGGLVDAADRIRKTILDAPMPTIAFIDKNAASAGALIAYANDRIVMVPGASIGAATVVEGVGGEAAPDKYQSYMRGMMRGTAEANGRDPRIAEAMVDQRIVIPGLVDSTQVLTLSTSEALQYGVADAEIATQDALLERLGVEQDRLVAHRETGAERVLRFFGSPVLQSILMLMMMGGLYFELQSPGVGFPGMIAAFGAALFFAPHYMLGLVQGWEIVVFVLGIVLILLELFIIPGFGIPGIAGLVCVVGALGLSLIGNIGFDLPSSDVVASALATLATTLVLTLVLGFSLGRYLPRSERFNRLVLADVPGPAIPPGFELDSVLVGREGTAVTPLRPAGTALIDGERVDVVTSGEWVPAGSAVRVVSARGHRVEVRPVPDAPATSA